MSFTRRQYAAAVQAAHDALHDVEDLRDPGAAEAIDRAHEALHAVYSVEDPPIACGTADPEVQEVLAGLREIMAQPLPCGHTLGDLIGGDRSVTKCGACLVEKRDGTGRFAPDVQPAEIGGD